MAEKIGEVRAERDQLKEDVAEVLGDLLLLIDTAQRHHDEMHEGVFRYCEYAVCQLADELEFGYSHEVTVVTP